MSPGRPLLTIASSEQTPLHRGRLTITPQSQVIDLRLPGGHWRWVRPQALLVQDGDTLERLPIPDRTRALALACLGAGLVGALLFLASADPKGSRRRSENRWQRAIKRSCRGI